MSDLHLHQAVYGGPAIHKTSKLNPNEVLTRLVSQYPKASRETILRLFVATVRGDDHYLIPIIEYFFLNGWAAIQAKSKTRSKAALKERRAEVDQFKRTLKRAVLIAELIMPNGKAVAECTGTEMGKFGKFGLAVGEIVGRRKVGAAMTEEELYKLWMKHR